MLFKNTAQAVGGLEAGLLGYLGDSSVGFSQQRLGELQTHASQFFHWGADKVFTKRFFQPAPRDSNLCRHIGHPYRLVRMVVNKTQGSGNCSVLNR